MKQPHMCKHIFAYAWKETLVCLDIPKRQESYSIMLLSEHLLYLFAYNSLTKILFAYVCPGLYWRARILVLFDDSVPLPSWLPFVWRQAHQLRRTLHFVAGCLVHEWSPLISVCFTWRFKGNAIKMCPGWSCPEVTLNVTGANRP